MVERSIDELARDLKQRRELGDAPLVVVLGAGASVDAGIGAMSDLFEFVRVTNFEEFVAYIGPFTPAERYRLLAQFLQSRQPAVPTPGYRALAALCADFYFDLLLTTNLDPLLDDSLAAAQLWRKDYLLLVNGIIRPERLDLLLGSNSPRVKVVKLHGDLFHRHMAWTPGEMDEFVEGIAGTLNSSLRGRDVLVVGHSLRDERIRKLVLDAGGVIWYTNPKSVPHFLVTHDRVRAVVHEDVAFERLFPSLASRLGVGAKAPSSPPTVLPPVEAGGPKSVARTMDDLMASIVAVVGPNGQPSSTGFVLADPPVVVTDAYAAEAGAVNGSMTIQTRDGRRLTAKVVGRHKHVFGPIILERPADLLVPGLKLNAAPVLLDQSVRIGVAVGDRIGVSSGAPVDGVGARVKIEPVGVVENLVRIRASVAPGSSGAPVVDETFHVRGFIVAGGGETALMHPATDWAGALNASPAVATGETTRTRREPRKGRRPS